MPGIFSNYNIALLDSSFFMAPFSKPVQDGLIGKAVYVSETFNTEIIQYREILPHTQRTYFETNLDFLSQKMKLCTLDMVSFKEKGGNLHNDIWGLLTLFENITPRGEIVVITSNKILIQRIVLHNYQIDIYDLNSEEFLVFGEFKRAKVKYELRDAEKGGYVDDDEQTMNQTRLYREDGTYVVLRDEIKSGLESSLYIIEGNPSLVAKVFKKGKLSANKFDNLQKIAGMNNSLEVDWALFPIDMLFSDSEAKNPAGFTESFASIEQDLSDNPLYAGQLEDMPFKYLNTKLSINIDLCIRVVRQVCYLNVFGFFVSDYNTGNFAIIKNNDRYIQMWDTDSFGYDTYFSGYCSGEKTTKDYDTSTKIGAIDFCIEAIYIFVFLLLSLGDSPISENNSNFKYDNPNYPFLYRSSLIPEDIWKLFFDVFTEKKIPSVESLLHQLTLALKKLEDNPSTDLTYGDLLKDVLKKEEHKKDLSAWVWTIIIVCIIIVLIVIESLLN